MSTVAKITKTLSKNDAGVGTTKGHGVLIPKDPVFQSFFPPLDASTPNPAALFTCTDVRGGEPVEVTYRYYNQKTRDEYRVTGISAFLRANNAVEGSRLSFSKTKSGEYQIELERSEEPESAPAADRTTPAGEVLPAPADVTGDDDPKAQLEEDDFTDAAEEEAEPEDSITSRFLKGWNVRFRRNAE